jgi:hypothetical protein
VNLILNDIDPDTNSGESEVIESFTQPVNGFVEFFGNDQERIIYTPNANYCNNGLSVETFSYTLTNQLSADVFITVNCSNDQPSFENLGSQVVEESDSFVINEWAFNIDFGAEDENSTQSVLAFHVEIVSDSNSILESVIVDINGNLTYQTTNNIGTAIVEVSLQDDGGTENSGIDTSNVHSFTVTKSDHIFVNGFESNEGFRLLDEVENLQTNPDAFNVLYYDFDSNSIVYYHYDFLLNDDYQSQVLIEQFKSWYAEIKGHISR